ncbi:MAG: hypothetical protein ABL959_22380, partial [Pyrinomonadaceae bacterium]
MKKVVFLSSTIMLFVSAAIGQIKLDAEQYRIFDGKGNPATMADVLKAAAASDALFLGEQHDDAVGHAFQA